jgi:hypothetical protein
LELELDVLSDTERSIRLDDEVERYVLLGYRVAARTPFTAQMVRPKTFSFGWALVWFLILFVGLFLYLLWFLAKQDSSVYLTVDADGAVHTHLAGEPPHAVIGGSVRPRGSAVCQACGHVNSASRVTCKSCRAPLR